MLESPTVAVYFKIIYTDDLIEAGSHAIMVLVPDFGIMFPGPPTTVK